jgi:adenylosuccinate synthase
VSIGVIVLSGPIGAGKSDLALQLRDRLGARVVKTNELIKRQSSAKLERSSLQRVGDRLDRDTGGAWVARGLADVLGDHQEGNFRYVVVDSVRITAQVDHLRATFPALVHVHLFAHEEELEKRYQSRSSGIAELKNYSDVRKNRTERNVWRLGEVADVAIDTTRCTVNDVYARVIARLGIRPGTAAPVVDALIGGQYGSEGKGNIAHFLAPEYDVLIRVGGPNAGHKVFVKEGVEPYTFHQLPSGALANGRAVLVLGAGAVISLDRLLKEISELAVPVDRLIIDPQAMIIEKEDIEWEQKELKDKIGSTAQGVGRATARKILNRYVGSDVRLARDVVQLQHYVKDTVDFFGECLSSGRRMFLEGTQGTTLSLHHGYYPHVTSRVTTVTGCLAEAGLAPRHLRRVVLVCRTFPIRVGNTDTGNTSGYMAQEVEIEYIAKRSGIPVEELRKTETTSTTRRKRRIAEFDWGQFRRSIILNGPTDIALTFADYLGVDNRKAYRYERLTADTLRFVEEMEKVGGLPVSLISTNFSTRNIIDRRAW